MCTLSPRASESTSCLKPLPLFPFPQPSLSTMCAPPLLQILVSIKKMPLLPASWLSQQGAAPTFYLHILSLLKYHGNNFSVKGTKKQLFFRTPRYSRWSWMERSTGLERDAHECEQPSVFWKHRRRVRLFFPPCLKCTSKFWGVASVSTTLDPLVQL